MHRLRSAFHHKPLYFSYHNGLTPKFEFRLSKKKASYSNNSSFLFVLISIRLKNISLCLPWLISFRDLLNLSSRTRLRWPQRTERQSEINEPDEFFLIFFLARLNVFFGVKPSINRSVRIACELNRVKLTVKKCLFTWRSIRTHFLLYPFTQFSFA